MSASPVDGPRDLPEPLVGVRRLRICEPVAKGAMVELGYELWGDPEEGAPRIGFTERVELPGPVDLAAPGVEGALRILAICAGTSYWKCAAPTTVDVACALTSGEVALLRHLYDHGMREFAVANGRSVPVEVGFEMPVRPDSPPTSESPSTAPATSVTTSEDRHPASPGGLVPVGGGKDSALVLSMFPRARAFAIGPPLASVRVAEAAGRSLISARRTLDPHLRELNERGALNGHIPVTAVTMAVSVLTAVAVGEGDVLMGVERSASEPTRWVGSEPVNHQYSKSLEFEDAFSNALRTAGVPARCFSVLRPFSELGIARALVQDEELSAAVLSCNRAFTLWRDTPEKVNLTWCRDCPKCRFTALMLAPFVTPERLVSIMGGNIFTDPSQATGFLALWDLDSKPFECVGEMVESAVAMATLAGDSRWGSTAVVARCGPSAAAFAESQGGSLEGFLSPGADHRVPEPYLSVALARAGTGGGE